jgi:hypothetical protein
MVDRAETNSALRSFSHPLIPVPRAIALNCLIVSFEQSTDTDLLGFKSPVILFRGNALTVGVSAISNDQNASATTSRIAKARKNINFICLSTETFRWQVLEFFEAHLQTLVRALEYKRVCKLSTD